MYTHTRFFGRASRGLESFKSYRFHVVSVGDVRPRPCRRCSWDIEAYTDSRLHPSRPIVTCSCVHYLFALL